ncbi:T9SS type A sorting domain-containing protein, partial [Tenacibaculum maritimum]|uniref:T9SS type A sorting domain-containing protein n=1 Tax=Tenacibaculum maritimum TaxID=107401 RepID=UPI0038778DE8
NVNLTSLSCADNQLTGLDVSNNVNLTSLSCADNQLTGLDVSNNVNLTSLSCGYNKLTELNVSNNVNLRLLSCAGNQLTELDVSDKEKLLALDCVDNKLIKLDVPLHSAFRSLLCIENQLRYLKVGDLKIFNSKENPSLTCIEVNNIELIPEGWSKDDTTQYSTNCSATADVDDIFTSKFKIYPNPVDDVLSISKSAHENIKKISIFNVIGKKILQANETTINCKYLPKGVYILKIEGIDDKIGIKKFIKS